MYDAVTGSVEVYNHHGMLLGRTKVDSDDVVVNMVWIDKCYISLVATKSTGLSL
jgi:hypothetical protein